MVKLASFSVVPKGDEKKAIESNRMAALQLFYGNRLRQILWLINITAIFFGHIVSQKL